MNLITIFTRKFEQAAVFSPILRIFCKMYYNKAVQREIELANITSDDRVLCIGGGPLPWTGIRIAQTTGAKVHVIDMDHRSVFYAKQAIEQCNLSGQIEVSIGNGQQIDASEYTVTHVALQARPHDKILQNILKRAKSGNRVLMRFPHSRLNKFYEALPEDCLCDICESTKQNHSTMSETLLFIKGVRGEKREEILAHAFGLDINRTATLVK